MLNLLAVQKRTKLSYDHAATPQLLQIRVTGLGIGCHLPNRSPGFPLDVTLNHLLTPSLYFLKGWDGIRPTVETVSGTSYFCCYFIILAKYEN